MVNILDKKSKALTGLLNSGEIEKRRVVYAAIGFVLMTELSTNPKDELNNKVFIKDVVYKLNELAIVDVTTATNLINGFILYRNRLNNLDHRDALGGNSFNDVIGISQIFGDIDIVNIDNHIELFKLAVDSFHAWYVINYNDDDDVRG